MVERFCTKESLSQGPGSRLLTSLPSATDVTARLCCHFTKLVPGEPSIPPHYLANTLCRVGADLPPLRISAISAVVFVFFFPRIDISSSSSFIPRFLVC